MLVVQVVAVAVLNRRANASRESAGELENESFWIAENELS